MKVSNYRCLREADVELNPELNIVVGANECGKSTLIEAINLGLTGLLNGRPIQSELHPYLFNQSAVADYLSTLLERGAAHPPSICIELYLCDVPQLVHLKDICNSASENVPGITLLIELNREYSEEFSAYLADPTLIKAVPIEYYVVRWRGFSDTEITARAIPIKPSFIDASTIKNNVAANRYVVDIIRDSLSTSDRVELALAFRLMKKSFLEDPKVSSVNSALAGRSGEISNKELTLSLDTSARASWESGVLPHLDDVPITLIGKGEQNAVKIKLALASAAGCHVVLVEEAENHLSFVSLNALIDYIRTNRGSRQLLITTHSSFVLNKLGIESVVLFNRGLAITLNELPRDTKEYFMKLPGHDTLRLILAERAILVEGPSDELIVQAAYLRAHGKPPLSDGIDVISVNSLAFKRFLDIARLLNHRVDVVTDNDGNCDALASKYLEYSDVSSIRVHYDSDDTCATLEPQLLKANGRQTIERILSRSFDSDEQLLSHMQGNKTDVALKFFSTDIPWTTPNYIRNAVE